MQTHMKSRSTISREATPPVYKEIGLRIKKRRCTCGLSQRQLAERIGQHRPSITLIEAGKQKVAVHELMSIAEALGVSVTCLLPKEM